MELIAEGAEEKAKELEELNSGGLHEDVNTKPSPKLARALAGAIPGLGNPEDYEEEEPEIENEEEIAGDEEDLKNKEGEEEEEAAEVKSVYSGLKPQLLEMYGEEDLSSDEDIESKISEIISENKALNNDKDTFNAVTDLFKESDAIVEIARLRNEGYTVNEAIARVIDFEAWQEEIKEDDPEEYKKVLKRQMEREEAQRREKEDKEEREKTFRENSKKSNQEWQEFESEFFGNDEGVVDQVGKKRSKEFVESINQHISDIADGKTSKEFFEVMYRGLNYGEDVKKAEQKGKVEGKNEAINGGAANKTKGDGLPNLRGGGSRRTRKEASSGKKAVASVVGNRSGNSNDWR